MAFPALPSDTCSSTQNLKVRRRYRSPGLYVCCQGRRRVYGITAASEVKSPSHVIRISCFRRCRSTKPSHQTHLLTTPPPSQTPHKPNSTQAKLNRRQAILHIKPTFPPLPSINPLLPTSQPSPPPPSQADEMTRQHPPPHSLMAKGQEQQRPP